MEATGYYHYRLAQFLYKNEVKVSVVYTALTEVQSECLQLFRLLDSYLKKRTVTKNKLHGEEVLGKPSKFVYRSLKRNRKHLDKEIKGIEEQLIISTDGFKKFETASQLCSYVGITPTIRKSGSSVRGRARISKVGNRKLRNLLFLCSFNACKYNKACKELYNRIVNKGKSKKLALIAVSNKLLKQSFAIAKSGKPYDESYVSVMQAK